MSEQRDRLRPLKRVSDADLDRAVGSLVGGEPSPGFARSLMARIAADEPRTRARGWQFAFAGAMVIVFAAAVWFALVPRQDRAVTDRSAGGRTANAVGRPGTAAETAAVPQPGGGGSAGARTSTIPQTVAQVRTPQRVLARRGTPAQAWQGTTSDTAVDLLPDMPPLEVTELAAPPPVVLTPMAVHPLQIPDITLTPVGEQGEIKPVPALPGQNDKQTAGKGSAPRS